MSNYASPTAPYNNTGGQEQIHSHATYDGSQSSVQAQGTGPQHNLTSFQQNGLLQMLDIQALGLNPNQLAALFAQLQSRGLPPQYFLPQSSASAAFPPLPPPPPPLSANPKSSTHVQPPVLSSVASDSHATQAPTASSWQSSHVQRSSDTRQASGNTGRASKLAAKAAPKTSLALLPDGNGSQQTMSDSRNGTINHEHPQPRTSLPSPQDDQQLTRKQQAAERFISLLSANKYDFDDLVREGLDPELLRRMFEELKLPVMKDNPKAIQQRPVKNKKAKASKLSSSKDKPVHSEAASSKTASSPKPLTLPKSSTKAAGQQAAATVSLTNSTRQAYLEKLKAAANTKQSTFSPKEPSSERVSAVSAATSSQTTTKTSSAAMPSRLLGSSTGSIQAARVAALAAEAEAKRRAQTELARKRMEALTAKRAATIPPKIVEFGVSSLPAPAPALTFAQPSENIPPATQSSTRTSRQSSSQEQTFSDSEFYQDESQSTNVDKGKMVSPEVASANHVPVLATIPVAAGFIPGLFVAENPRTSPSSTHNLPQTAVAAESSRSKRSLSFGQDDARSERPASSLKRPFVNRSSSKEEDRCIIEVSDDETGSMMDLEDENDEVAVDALVRGKSHTQPPKSNIPSHSLPTSTPGSIVGTPNVHTPSSSYSNDQLRKKEAEIALMKLKIREREANKKRVALLQSSRVQTPASSVATPERATSPRTRSALQEPLTQHQSNVLQTEGTAINHLSPPQVESSMSEDPTSKAEAAAHYHEENASLETFDITIDSSRTDIDSPAVVSPDFAHDRQRSTSMESGQIDSEDAGTDEEGVHISATIGSESTSREEIAPDTSAGSSNEVEIPTSSNKDNANYQNQGPSAEDVRSMQEATQHTDIASSTQNQPTFRIPGLDLSSSNFVSEAPAMSSVFPSIEPTPSNSCQGPSIIEEDDPMDFSDMSDELEGPESTAQDVLSAAAISYDSGALSSWNVNNDQTVRSPGSSIFSTSTPDESFDLAPVSNLEKDAQKGRAADASPIIHSVTIAENAGLDHEEQSGASGETSQSSSGSDINTDYSSDESEDEVFGPTEARQHSAPAAGDSSNSSSSGSVFEEPELAVLSDIGTSNATTAQQTVPGDITTETQTQVSTSPSTQTAIIDSSGPLAVIAEHPDKSAVNRINVDLFTPYESPLKMFKAYRFHPDYPSAVTSGFRSMTYSHKIDANKELCQYEAAGGVCNDEHCTGQHFRSMALTDDMMLLQLGTSNPGRTPEEKQRWNEGLKTVLNDLRQLDTKDADVVASAIVNYRRDFLHSEMNLVN